eukprot:2518524-Rhodomonas_salina.2
MGKDILYGQLALVGRFMPQIFGLPRRKAVMGVCRTGECPIIPVSQSWFARMRGGFPRQRTARPTLWEMRDTNA